MRIPRIVRDLQVERETLFLDFFSQRLFHRLDLFFAQRRQELSFRAVVSDAMSCDHEGQGHVQVLMDDGLVMPRLNSHTLWIAGWKTGC